jgi:hypothetical protein
MKAADSRLCPDSAVQIRSHFGRSSAGRQDFKNFFVRSINELVIGLIIVRQQAPVASFNAFRAGVVDQFGRVSGDDCLVDILIVHQVQSRFGYFGQRFRFRYETGKNNSPERDTGEQKPVLIFEAL